MDIGHWKNKIQVVQNFGRHTGLLSGNSMGIYFEARSKHALVIHYKPLNEGFKEGVFNADKGILINFERDLIDEDDIEYALDVMALFNTYPRYRLSDPDEAGQIRKLIDLISAEFHGDQASYIMLKTLLKVLLLHLIRYQNDGFLVQDLNQNRVFRFLELMETHYLQETDAGFYARELGIGLKRLNQILKSKLNLTAKQIIQQRQITEAKRRLVRSDVSTKELAFELGFGSLSSFSRFFKKNVGVNPTVYKMQN